MRQIDDRLYRLVTRSWPEEKIESYTDRLLAAHDETVVPSVVRHHFEVIDTKAAGLLTHTSMMVAAIGIAATIIAGSIIEQAIMIAEIMLYLLVAIVCLRCSALFRELTEDDDRAPEWLRRELILRRELMMFCNTATIYLTILILITLPIILYV
jgi:uncharacterized membrane protein